MIKFLARCGTSHLSYTCVYIVCVASKIDYQEGRVMRKNMMTLLG